MSICSSAIVFGDALADRLTSFGAVPSEIPCEVDIDVKWLETLGLMPVDNDRVAAWLRRTGNVITIAQGCVLLRVAGAFDDDDQKRAVCEWALDEPRLAALVEGVLLQAFGERVFGLSFVTHNVPPLSNPLDSSAAGSATAMCWNFGNQSSKTQKHADHGDVVERSLECAPPSDASGLALASTVQHAATVLFDVHCVSAMYTSQQLPCVVELMHRASREKHVAFFECRSGRFAKFSGSLDDMPADARAQVAARNVLCAQYTWYSPRVADDALLYVACDNAEHMKKIAAAVDTLVLRAPRDDFPPFTANVRQEILTRAAMSQQTTMASDSQLLYAHFFEEDFSRTSDLERLVQTIRNAPRLACVDLAAARGVTVDVVVDLCRLSHVATVAVIDCEPDIIGSIRQRLGDDTFDTKVVHLSQVAYLTNLIPNSRSFRTHQRFFAYRHTAWRALEPKKANDL